MSYTIAMLSVHTSPLAAPGQTKDAGGMNVYMRALAQELVREQVHIDIFTRWTDETLPQVVQVAPHLRVIHIKAGPVASVHKHDLYSYLPLFTRHIEEFRRNEARDYDILHSHYWLSGVAAQQLARQWDIPHVTMFHTLGKLKQQVHPDEPEPALRLEMEQRLIQKADYIIAATNDERTQMIRSCGALPGRVGVIPCGVDLERFQPYDRAEARKQFGINLHQPVVVFAGRLDPFKGPDILIKAAKMMREDAQIVIVGGRLHNDPDLHALQVLARELRIQHRIRFLGAQPQSELPKLYSAADVTVIPSYHESFGLVAVESLACGTPVVATRAGGLTTVIRDGETGFLVPRCPGFFAERIDALLRNADLHAKMRVAARPSVLQYSWERVANRVYQVYDQLTQEASCLVAQ